MNIHEYQAKEVLRGFGVTTGKGIPAFTVEDAVKAADVFLDHDDWGMAWIAAHRAKAAASA